MLSAHTISLETPFDIVLAEVFASLTHFMIVKGLYVQYLAIASQQ
jgi:hypothetical protein